MSVAAFGSTSTPRGLSLSACNFKTYSKLFQRARFDLVAYL
jgi:hypothetical protein